MAESRDDMNWLAGEYVVGTLDGEQRAAFERLLQQDPGVQKLVVAWEERLVGIAEQIPPKSPPSSTWQAIESRLDARMPQRSVSEKPVGRWAWRTLWGGVAAAAMLSVVLLVVVPLVPGLKPEAPAYTLVLQGADSLPQWRLSVNWSDREMTVKRIGAAFRAEHDYELWLLPTGDGAPVSLGLLRGEQVTTTLPDTVHWRDAKAFAVSLEPRGGSPTGAPTGPVLYVAQAPAKQA